MDTLNSTADQSEEARGTSRPMVVVAGAIALLVLVGLVIEFRLIVLGTLVGVGGGVLIAPLINWLKRPLRVPRGISGLLVVLLLAAAAGGIGRPMRGRPPGPAP